MAYETWPPGTYVEHGFFTPDDEDGTVTLELNLPLKLTRENARVLAQVLLDYADTGKLPREF